MLFVDCGLDSGASLWVFRVVLAGFSVGRVAWVFLISGLLGF